MAVALQVYGDHLDIKASYNFFNFAMESPSVAIFRGKRSFGIVQWGDLVFVNGMRHAILRFLAALPGNDWEPMKILRRMKEWSIQQNCVTFEGGSETNIDISPLMKRLGAKCQNPSYRIELKDAK